MIGNLVNFIVREVIIAFQVRPQLIALLLRHALVRPLGNGLHELLAFFG